MLSNLINDQSVVAFTDASFKATKGRRSHRVTGGVLYASEGTLLSGFLMNLAQFSLRGSDEAEMLTSALGVALAPLEYNLTALHTDCMPSLKKLCAYQEGTKDIKSLAPEFDNKARFRMSKQALDFKKSSRYRASVEVAHRLADKAKHLRSGAQAITFDAHNNIVYGDTYTWKELAS